jgi:hypothetical protein
MKPCHPSQNNQESIHKTVTFPVKMDETKHERKGKWHKVKRASKKDKRTARQDPIADQSENEVPLETAPPPPLFQLPIPFSPPSSAPRATAAIWTM